MVGRPADLIIWVRDVTPHVSQGTLWAYNQSIVGAVARLIHWAPADLGNARVWVPVPVGLRVRAGALLGLWFWRRHHPLDSLELGVLILVAVLAGPLSWDHYSTYALVAVVLMVDYTKWTRLRPPEIGGLLGRAGDRLRVVPQGDPSSDPHQWPTSGPCDCSTDRYAICLILLLIVALWLLARAPAADEHGPQWPDDGANRCGSSTPVVAGRVH